MVDYKKQGKKNRATGAAFELRVRKDLESKGWVVDKWSNNVEFDKNESTVNPELSEFKGIVRKEFAGGQWIKKITYGKLVPAKNKWAGPNRPMMMGAGFPDFSCHFINEVTMDIIGVEAKSNGRLSKQEKEKCRWYLDNKIFSKILIAFKTKKKNRIKVNYKELKIN